MSAPSLHVDALRAGPTAFRGLRLRLKRVLPVRRVCASAWWPRTINCPSNSALAHRALTPRTGTVDRVTSDENIGHQHHCVWN